MSRGRSHCGRRIKTAKAHSLEEEVQEGGKSREKNMTIRRRSRKRTRKEEKKRKKKKQTITSNCTSHCTVKSCSPYGTLPDSNLCFCTYHQLNFTHGTQVNYLGG
jgi:hypothetical protein